MAQGSRIISPFRDFRDILPSDNMKRFKPEVILIKDEETITLLNQRDERGITALRESYGRLLKSLAYGILRSEQDAEECESEARSEERLNSSH